MARLQLKKDHNKFDVLKKAKGHHERHDSMVEFLQRSKIHYALTHSPDVIYESMVKQFWASARKRSDTKIVDQVFVCYINQGTNFVFSENIRTIAAIFNTSIQGPFVIFLD
jgi:hypothetical protein